MPVAEPVLSTAEQVERDNAAADAAARAAEAATPPEIETPPAAPEPGEPPAEPEPAAPAAPDPQDAQVLSYFKTQLGDQPWLNQFKSAAELIKAIPEMQSLIGRQGRAVATLRQLEESGFTAEEYARWLANRATGGQPQAQPQQNQLPDWDPKWVVVGQDGKAYMSNQTPPGMTQADWELRLNRHASRMQQAILNPAMLAETLKPYLAPEINQALGQTRQQIEAKQAQDAQAAEARALFEQNKSLYYTPDGTAFSAFGARVNELMESQIIAPNAPYATRMKAAHDLALREMPQPKARNVPANAKPIQQPAVRAPKSITADEWMTANPDSKFGNDRGKKFQAFNDAVNKGEVTIT